jgi:hypothetical protein
MKFKKKPEQVNKLFTVHVVKFIRAARASLRSIKQKLQTSTMAADDGAKNWLKFGYSESRGCTCTPLHLPAGAHADPISQIAQRFECHCEGLTRQILPAKNTVKLGHL